jgi:hypothetical protein
MMQYKFFGCGGIRRRRCDAYYCVEILSILPPGVLVSLSSCDDESVS